MYSLSCYPHSFFSFRATSRVFVTDRYRRSHSPEGWWAGPTRWWIEGMTVALRPPWLELWDLCSKSERCLSSRRLQPGIELDYTVTFPPAQCTTGPRADVGETLLFGVLDWDKSQREFWITTFLTVPAGAVGAMHKFSVLQSDACVNLYKHRSSSSFWTLMSTPKGPVGG